MIYQLTGQDRIKILPLIKNSRHELTIDAVIYGNSPGRIYVDDSNNPKSGLIETSECRVIFGNCDNSDFNSHIIKEIGYWGAVTCDEKKWGDLIEKNHSNRAVHKYNRRYYKLCKSDFIKPDESVHVDLLDYNSINNLNYNNSEIVKDWINILNIKKLKKYSLAAVVNKDNTIASCSAFDCIVDNKIEIGIQTTKGFRKQGYGKSVVSALIKSSFSNGIEEIGWHCANSNIGSIKIAESLGFKLIKKYESYTPFPPIENISDLTTDEWREYAQFYMDKAKENSDLYWFTMICWANSGDLKQVNTCIQNMLRNKQYWFISKLDEREEFQIFNDDIEWKQIKDELQ
ncbi:MAG: GNAT family N-acetyltransferase, partial [Spirochaetaceae bacterium]|nr:GNAT family N-acetyltransferase [Spirochaetaceae bacterium]